MPFRRDPAGHIEQACPFSKHPVPRPRFSQQHVTSEAWTAGVGLQIYEDKV